MEPSPAQGWRMDPRAALPVAAIAFVIAATAAFLVSSRQPGTFEARATLSEDATLSRLGPDPEAARTTGQRLMVYARVAGSQPVLNVLSERFGISVLTLERMIDTDVSEDGDLLTITGRSRDAALVTAVVNAAAQEVIETAARDSGSGSTLGADVSDELAARLERLQRLEETVQSLSALQDPRPAQVRRLRRLSRLLESAPQSAALLVPLADGRSASPLSIVDPAITPTEPVEPRPAVDALLAGLLGALVVLPLVVVPHFLDRVVHDPADIREETGLPTLAVIPRVPGDWHRPRARLLATLLAPTSMAAEAYRTVRVGLDLSTSATYSRAVLVAAPRRTEARTTVAVNLAVALAQSGRRVVLVDADIDRPRAHAAFGIPNVRGLADALMNPDLEYDSALVPTVEPGLRVLTAGDPGTHRHTHVETAAMRRLVARLKGDFDVVVIHGPPLSDSGVPEILGPMADAVILALDAGRSHRDEVRDTTSSLVRAGARVLGVALLRTRPRWLPRLPLRSPRAGREARTWSVPPPASTTVVAQQPPQDPERASD
jgi:capsular exopolysaccharide synthesis family protein